VLRPDRVPLAVLARLLLLVPLAGRGRPVPLVPVRERAALFGARVAMLPNVTSDAAVA
jgi:hypothetical protein